jgi:hypothetical protein
MQPSRLVSLDFEDTWLHDCEVESLCKLLGRDGCRIGALEVGGHAEEEEGGGGDDDGQAMERRQPLSDAHVARLFRCLASCRSLLILRVAHRVDSTELARCVVEGVKSNRSLTKLTGLVFEVDGSQQFDGAVSFWTRSNARGRSVVEKFLRRPPRRLVPGSGAHLSCRLAGVLHQCSAAAASPSSAARDVPVLYHFVRQLAPALMDHDPTENRGRKRPRNSEESEEPEVATSAADYA